MTSQSFFVLLNGQWLRIEYGDVLLIEAEHKYSLIITSRITYRQEINISRMQEIIDPDYFCRVHRRYILPLHRIRFVTRELVNLGDREVPIGESYYRDFMMQLPLLK